MLKPKYKVKAVKQIKQQQQQQQKQVVYFRLRRPAHLNQPQPQLIVNRFPHKKNQQHLQQNTQQNIQKHQQKIKEQTDQLSKLFSNINIKNNIQFFLTRIDNTSHIAKQTLDKADQISKQTRSKNRQQIFQKSRGILNPTIKIMQICQNQQFVELGNQKVAVQNLNMLQTNDYYYVLNKRNTIKQGPTVHLPEQSNYLFDKIQFQEHMSEQQNNKDNDEQDSNRESNPDYDYPQQDNSDQNSDDQGVINRDYYHGRSDDEDQDSDPPQYTEQDQEEMYRKYLKECSKKQRNKYEDEDDDDDQ